MKNQHIIHELAQEFFGEYLSGIDGLTEIAVNRPDEVFLKVRENGYRKSKNCLTPIVSRLLPLLQILIRILSASQNRYCRQRCRQVNVFRLCYPLQQSRENINNHP